MIEAHGLTKTYGKVRAVDDLSFSVRPGVVTGFLGPNGAGKSTALRLILNLDHPNAGTATINGKRYEELEHPMRAVGALLDGRAFHPRRTARNHLRWLAAAAGMPESRVDEVLELVGLTSAAKKKTGGFSLGMGQRLGIAAALIGDPEVLLFDEPMNGLDPEGIRWVRTLMKSLANQGRTVLVSSHLLSEMSVSAQDLVVIGKGKLLEQTTVAEFTQDSGAQLRVRAVAGQPGLDALTPALERAGAQVTAGVDPAGRPSLTVTGVAAEAVGQAALDAEVALAELSEQRATLEDAFLEKTHQSSEYRTAGGA